MRRRMNEIKGILDNNGHWTENPQAIEDTFSSYFREIFSSSNPSKEVMEDVLKLIKPKVDPSMNESFSSVFKGQGRESHSSNVPN